MVAFDNPGKPKQPIERERALPMVRLYSVCDALIYRREDGTVVYPLISIGNRETLKLPPIGEHFDVKANVAATIENQTRTTDRQGNIVPGVTRDPQFAKLKKQQFESGKPLAEVVAEYAATSLSDEAILALVKARGLKLEEAAAADTEPTPETVIENTESRGRGRPAKES